MKKVLRLVSVQLLAMFMSMLAIGEQKKKKTKALYIGFITFILLISGMSFFYSYMMGSALIMFNSLELLPPLFMALTSVVVLFASIYKVKGTLFGFKDYDMVMSLPVSNSKIVASRLILLYSINMVFVLIIMLPMMLAYGILANPGGQFYILSILLLPFIPLIPLVIASLIGTIITYVSMHFRFSNIVYIAISIALLLGMIIVPFFIGDSAEALVDLSQVLTRKIYATYPLAELYSKAVTQGDIRALVLFLLVSILIFMVFSLGVGKVFKRINTVVMTGRYKANYKLGALKSSSPLRALYIKDLKRYFASPIYVMNTGIGVVIMVVGAIALPFIDLVTIAEEIGISGAVQYIVLLFITFSIATSCTTMASISIEGKNIWIIKGLPISVVTIFASKILVNLTILAPVLFASIFISIFMKLSFIEGALIVLMTASYSIFVSLYGLVINLSFPNLTWTNETVIIKQSTASMITIFFGLGLMLIQYLLLMIIGNLSLVILLFIGLLWIINLLLYKRLTNKGRIQFEKL